MHLVSVASICCLSTSVRMALLGFLVLFISGTGTAQNNTVPLSTEQTHLQANNTIARAIQVMGGEGWARYGAAKADVTETSFKLPTRQSTWNDDWTGDSVRSRRETTSNGGSADVFSGTGHYLKSSTKSVPLALEFDLLRLISTYPAVVLNLAATRRGCVFRTLTDIRTVPPDDIDAIEMQCKTRASADGYARLLWRFSPDGRPSSVRIFTANPKLTTQRSKTIDYLDFNSVDGLVVAASVDITNGSMRQHLTFSNQTFAASSPSSMFP